MKKRNGGSRVERWRALVIRRQNVVYALLIVIGVQYLVRSALGSPSLVSEGAAFIMVGCVGLIMSFTTMDIAGGLKDVVRKEGTMTREIIREEGTMTREIIREEGTMTREIIREGLDGLGRQIGLQIDALGGRMEERDKRMEERLGRMGASIESMSADIESMSEDNRAFFRQMLEAQNLILKKVS